MCVARETEMCLFSTHVPSSQDCDDASANMDMSEVEIRYSLKHTFNNPSHPVDNTPHLIPLFPDIHALNLKEVNVTMHHSPTTGYDMGSKYNDWFSERFGYKVRLLYIGGNKRLVLGNMSPNIAGRQMRMGTRGEGVERDYESVLRRGRSGAETDGAGVGGGWVGSAMGLVKGALGGSQNKENQDDNEDEEEDEDAAIDQGITFSDVAPYLVISTKSWENAQRRLPPGENMDISKFRPNIIVEGAGQEFEEDYWAEIQIGEKAVIVLTQNCNRCNSLNVDYGTGKVGVGEGGRMLKKLQSDRRVDLGAKYSPIFGRYGFLKRVDGGKVEGEGVEISVGDEVKVIKKNEVRTRLGKYLCSVSAGRQSKTVVLGVNADDIRMAEVEHRFVTS